MNSNSLQPPQIKRIFKRVQQELNFLDRMEVERKGGNEKGALLISGTWSSWTAKGKAEPRADLRGSSDDLHSASQHHGYFGGFSPGR